MVNQIEAMKQDLAELQGDDDNETPMPHMRHQQSHSIIPERYEHQHDPNK